MSEFLAQARVLVTPDTTRFRAELEAQLALATAKPIVVPVVAQAATAQAVGATTALSAAQQGAIASTAGFTKAVQLEGAALQQATIAARAHAVAQSQVGKAAVANTAGMLGLRGAVLTAGTAFIAATVGFQALGKAIGSAVSFERELNVFQVTAGATADQMERVTAVARELGRDITLPGVAANDAAQALSLLARAGLSVEDSINAVRGTLQLATAAQIENAAAAELVANALNAFKLSGDQATRVADLLAGAANESQGSIADMGLALKQTASIASGLGISVEDTVTILTQLSRAGLSASDAGTSFRQTLLRLIQDLPRVTQEVSALGLNLRDASGNIRPQVFEELGKKLKALTPAARQLAIANLGGADAIRTLLILTRAQAGEFDTLEAAITKTGLAQDLSAARTKGLGGDVEAAKNQFADLGLTVGQVASGPLSQIVIVAGQAAGAMNELAGSLERVGGRGGFLSEFGKVVNDFANSFGRLNISFQQGIRLATTTRDNFSVLASAASVATTAVEGLASALEKVGSAVIQTQGLPKDSGLSVQQITNRVAGFDAEEVRARISGDNQSIVAVLQQEQEFLIAQLDRQFVKNRPALRRSLENALLGVGTEIEAITQKGATTAKNAAAEAARAASEADRALLDALGQRRDDAARKIAAAADTAGVQDDIRRQNELQALIKIQIAKVRERIKGEQERKAAIRDLRIALIASRREEDALRQQQAEERAAARQENINLDIAFAETTGNVAREIAARQRLIALLKKQQASVKKGTNEWKRLRNEIATQQQAIKDAKKESEKTSDTGKSAQQFFFEQLQAQQGFASNLLGNLIPSGQTSGLVGVPSPTTGPGKGVSVAASVQEAKASSGPTAGQANATINRLDKIIAQLQELNGDQKNPEAHRQRKGQHAVMDYGAGGGDGVVM